MKLFDGGDVEQRLSHESVLLEQLCVRELTLDLVRQMEQTCQRTTPHASANQAKQGS